MRSPDAAWVTKKRWDALNAQDQDRFSHISPEFIVELRSPSDNLAELRNKMEQWIANGVEVGWLIDPIEHTVYVYRPGDSLRCIASRLRCRGGAFWLGLS
jgi:Uma2 family endonuclease